MIVARAVGVTALGLFEPLRWSPRPPRMLAPESASTIDDEGIAWLDRSGIVVRLHPVPTAPVRFGPALRTHGLTFASSD
jgi:hypothetical protein